MKFYTPLEVAKALAKYAPKGIQSILEPSVGNGVLLESMYRRLKSVEKIVCVDIDKNALMNARTKLEGRFGSRLATIQRDFLQWSAENMEAYLDFFDCIIMNPPFGGKKSQTKKIDLKKEINHKTSAFRATPIECLFILRSVRMLKQGGRLLAIVPSSMVSAISTSWIRKYLLESGSILCVHELNKFTFEKVEARVYLFVFEKSTDRKNVLLCNHDVLKPDKLRISREVLDPEYRLDYRYHEAINAYDVIVNKNTRLNWKSLSTLAQIYRGSVNSPFVKGVAVHSTHYENGFWSFSNIVESPLDGERIVKGKDLLMKRVSRNCAKTIGPVGSGPKSLCSDCVLIIRPNQTISSIRLLFSLKVLFTFQFGANLVERGTGATYVTEESLSNLKIPYALAATYPDLFLRYEEAVQKRNFSEMIQIENTACSLIEEESILA